ncbi:hypothetical protein DM01DRAFT_1331569 [Hesseltinella vesiculosa]|uniref:Uncharacterized protein n=1 Tax=Hesseltinella vesiculosa TaxID=101127 RepID=A0A1X2GVT3_9FUNG|nr:hypothetical protein DM01DRAFT_1331569 [Hesseltinella vesiculosa]
MKFDLIFLFYGLFATALASSDDDAAGATLKAADGSPVKCNDLSNAVYSDVMTLANTTLIHTGNVKVNESGYFIVSYKSASAVSKKTGANETTIPYAKLLKGISAIITACKEDDGKLSGSYYPSQGYRICLTGTEETDDC